jgi:hypothetical protein
MVEVSEIFELPSMLTTELNIPGFDECFRSSKKNMSESPIRYLFHLLDVFKWCGISAGGSEISGIRLYKLWPHKNRGSTINSSEDTLNLLRGIERV